MTVRGEQHNGNIWILNKECYLDKDRSILDPSDSPFYRLSDHISNPAIAPAGSILVVKFPLKTIILHDLILTIFPVMEHNAISSLFLLRASAMSFHYRTILETNTWATITEQFKVWTVLWQWPMAQAAKAKPLLFFQNFHFLEAKKTSLFKGDQRKLRINFARQTVPIGLDDPQSVRNISELLINWPLWRCKKREHKKRFQ